MELIKDNHTLCIQAGGVPLEEVKAKIDEWMKPFPNCVYQFVIGTNYQNEFMGFGYLWSTFQPIGHGLEFPD